MGALSSSPLTFVALYNSKWRTEKNNFGLPHEIRQAAQSKLLSKEPVPLQ